nr:hypothetical protein [Enterococcus innesii]
MSYMTIKAGFSTIEEAIEFLKEKQDEGLRADVKLELNDTDRLEESLGKLKQSFAGTKD